MRFSGVQRRAPGGDTRAILHGRERSGWGPGAQRSLRLALIGAVLVLTSGGIGAVSYVEAKHGGRYTAMQLFPGRVAWVDLESNAAIRPGLPGGLLDWRLLALESGVELHYRRIDTLADLNPEQYSALILSEQERLSDREWELALHAAQRGTALIWIGHPGLQRSNGARRQEILLDELEPGASFVRVKKTEAGFVVGSSAATVAGREPGASGALNAPSARLLRLARGPGAGLVSPGAPTRSACGRWIYRGTPILWLSAGLAEIAARNKARELAANLLAQALRRPSLALRDWPEGATGAFVLAERGADVEPIEAAGIASVVSHFDPASEPTQLLHVGRYLRLFQNRSTASRTFIAAGAVGGLEPLALSALEAELDRSGVWTPRSAELLNWWRAREALQVALRDVRAGRVEVRFRNTGAERVEGATARIFLPDDARLPRGVEGGTIWSRPVLRLDTKGRWVDLVAGSLPPNRSAAYHFEF